MHFLSLPPMYEAIPGPGAGLSWRLWPWTFGLKTRGRKDYEFRGLKRDLLGHGGGA